MSRSKKVKDAIDAKQPVEDEGFSLYGGAPAEESSAEDDGDDFGDSPEGDDYGANSDDEWERVPDDVDPIAWELVRSCAALDQNDRDNGKRLCWWFGCDLGYVTGMGWVVWNGMHWVRDEGELHARLLAQNIVDKIKLEPFHIELTPDQVRVVDKAKPYREIFEDDLTPSQSAAIKRADKIMTALYNKRTKRKNFAVSSGNAGKTTAMLTQAASLKRIDQNSLDRDHMRFNVRNGTLIFSREPDLEQDMTPGEDGEPIVQRMIPTFEVVNHDRQDMITKMADVDYDEKAACPNFIKMLERAHPDPAMRRFLQVFHAFAMLVGGNDEQKLIFHYGTGANGKSALIEALGRLAGSYRTVVSPDTITGEGQRQGQQASPDIARLFNTRFVTVEELPKNVPLKEDLIKAVSGGSKMTARFLQKEIFEFEPIFVAVMSGNSKPSINGADYGIWRRVLLVHWAVTIPAEERIPFGKLMSVFDAERPGILNWLIEGLLLYLRDGLDAHIPHSVTAFTQDYREERDNVSVFAEHGVVREKDHKLKAGILYKAYVFWCESNGLRPASQRSFGDKMAELGFEKLRGANYVYLDLRLADGIPTAPAASSGRTALD